MITKRSSLKNDLKYYSDTIDATYRKILSTRPMDTPDNAYYARSVLLLYQKVNPIANAIAEKQSLKKRKPELNALKNLMQDALDIMTKFLWYKLRENETSSTKLEA